MSVTENWRRIIEWHDANVPTDWYTLNAGADLADIEMFERRANIIMPDDFRESLLLYDGGDFWIPLHGELMSIQLIGDQWDRYVDWQRSGTYAIAGSTDWTTPEISGPIKPIFWNPRRIFITDASGEHLTLDLDPPTDGSYGQIIEHTVAYGPTHVLAESWDAFLANIADDLENGLLEYNAEEDSVLESNQTL